MTDPKTPPSAAGQTEIPEEVRRRLDALDEQLGTIDHYAILGVPRTATRAQIRTSLLASAPAFHPDRYFGKKLDPVYKAKMERVFARMALAHDTLIDDVRRRDYDLALPASSPASPAAGSITRPPAASSSPSPPMVQPRHAPSDSGGDPRHAPSRPPSVKPPGSPGSIRAPAASSPEFERTRAQAFASRLAGGTRMRQPTPVHGFHPAGTPKAGQPTPLSPSSPGMPAADPKAAVDALRRRYEESVARAQTRQASTTHVHAAEQAAARGDHAEAARLYRVALDHSSDPAMKASLVQAELRAKEHGRDETIAKAKELEQRQEFVAAGATWARAFDLAPNAEIAHRAAVCFRRGGTDMRRAAKYGEEAVKLDPHKVPFRVNLALIYAEAGLTLRARGEIERAQALDPKNASVKEAAQKIKSMG